MRIFHDLGIVESLGSGLPRILKKYPESVIDIRDSYIRITFPFAKGYIQASDSMITDNSSVGNVGNVGNCADISDAITDNIHGDNVAKQANERSVITDNVGNGDIKSRIEERICCAYLTFLPSILTSPSPRRPICWVL